MALDGMLVGECLAKIAEKSPAPGGGAAASLVGAVASALAQMVVAYSVGKKSLAEHQESLQGAIGALEAARSWLLHLAEEDARAYGLVNELMRLPEGDPRRAELPSAIETAARVPLEATEACAELAKLLSTLATRTNRQLKSDLAIAAILADAAARASRWNVVVNVALIEDAGVRDGLLRRADEAVETCARICREVEAACV